MRTPWFGQPPKWCSPITLCVRLDNMGDVLMTTPALRALKHSAPQRHLTLLASRTGAAAADFVDEIDDAIVYAAPWMKQERAEPGSVLPMAQMLRRRRDQAQSAQACLLPPVELVHLHRIHAPLYQQVAHAQRRDAQPHHGTRPRPH